MKQINLIKAWIFFFVATVLCVCFFSCTPERLQRNESTSSIELTIQGRTIVYDQATGSRIRSATGTDGYSFVGTKNPTDQNYFSLVWNWNNGSLLVYREGTTTGNCSTPSVINVSIDPNNVLNADFSGVINTGGNNFQAVTGEIKNVQVN